MRYLLSLTIACSMAACALNTTPTTPQWDQQFGSSTRNALSRQIIDLAPPHRDDAVSGMDGSAAHAAYQRYQKAGSDAAPQPSALTIGVSGAK